MEIKYYDLLSTTIIGIVIIAVFKYTFLNDIDIDDIIYISIGYIVGYFINSIGSLLENIYYKSIGGAPSDRLLLPIEGQSWTGYKKVRFYEAERVIVKLKSELKDPNASAKKMFGYAMRKVNSCEQSRVPTFNAHYALSRTILTAVLFVDVTLAFNYYNNWIFWVSAILILVISWNRYKERSYYYVREVLNTYLSQTTN